MRADRILGISLTLALLSASAGAAPIQGLIENRGQFDPAVLFFGAQGGISVRFGTDGPVLEATVGSEAASPALADARHLPIRAREQRRIESGRRVRLRIGFAAGAVPRKVEGDGLLGARYHFLLGRADGRTAIDAPAWERVAYRDVRPGVDVVFALTAEGLAYAIRGDDPSAAPAVELLFAGDADALDVDGVLKIDGAADEAPASRAIDANPQSGTDLRFSTFLGGSRDEAVYAIAVDSQDRPVVAGATRSTAFPTTAGASDTTYGGSFDAFVTKLDADGSTVLWSTFVGGTGDDRIWSLRLDDAGRPVIAGVTGSSDFPMAGAPYDDSFNGGGYDAFVAKLEADGSALVYSTYFGGSGREWDLSSLALDVSGRPTIAGSTGSADLPLSAVTLDGQLDGPTDGFVARFAVDGSALDFATYLGGAGDDAVEDLALDALDRPVVAGRTFSDDFPTSPTAYAPLRPGPVATEDAFVAKLDPATGSLVFGTYLGAEASDQAFAIALDAAGRPVVAGMTESALFPGTAGGAQPAYAGLRDAFVAALSADGSALAWATYFGGGAGDLALDGLERPLFTGYTCSEDFPLAWNAYDLTFNGPCESYVARLHEDGSYVEYASFVGGWRDDSGYAIALDRRERPLVGGEAFSSDFPATPSAYDPTHNSPDTDYDAFVFALLPPTFCLGVSGPGPTVTIDKATRGNCPPGQPIGGTVQIVEGGLEQVGASDLGSVRSLVCDAGETVVDSDTVPAPGRGLFLLARYTPGGSYTDGGGSTLVGSRTPAAGDCP